MKWIREHKLVSTLILVMVLSLGLLAVTLIFGESGGTGFINRLYTAIERPMTNAGSKLNDNVSGLFAYQKLLDENERLREENDALQEEVAHLTMNAGELQELRELAKALNYDLIESEKDIVTANVISMDGTNWTNAFMIDKGTESGIALDNYVICGEGLVGRIMETDVGWSKVLPIIDESSRISFALESNRDLLGIIEGSSDGTLTGYMLDTEAEAKDGDILVTSGLGRFPSGIKIGKVSRAGYDSNKQLMTITVRSEVEFAGLRKVSVVI